MILKNNSSMTRLVIDGGENKTLLPSEQKEFNDVPAKQVDRLKLQGVDVVEPIPAPAPKKRRKKDEEE